MESQLEQQFSKLKLLKVEKGIIAAKFKHLQKGTTEHAQQLVLMTEISNQIKLLEAAIKATATDSIQSDAQQAASANPFHHLDQNRLWNNELQIELKEFGEVQDWDEFVRQNCTSLPSHNPVWASVIEQSFGHPSFILCARSESGILVGGIPFTLFVSPLFGRFGVSMPYLNYGGVVSEYFDVCTALMRALEGTRRDLDLKYIEVRSIYNGLGNNPSTKKASMLLRLPDSDDALDKMLGSKVRAQYKKAEEFNPRVVVGKKELLNDFYQVFARNMRDLGTPVYSKKWFSHILAQPALHANIIVVYVKDRPVSCGFLVRFGTLMEIPWASTIKSANKYNANMWMYRKILSFAIEQGCDYFDFGRSTLDAGTYKFKKQWGAEACQNYWHCLLPNDATKPELNPDNPKLKAFIFLWKWLPLWLANLIGPHIIKGIP